MQPVDAPKPTEPFDPEARLPGVGDPWTGSSMPPRRPGPPYHMTEMIEAEPALARRILGRLLEPGSPAAILATAIRGAASAGRPVLVVGCGTSEHGAVAVAEILREAQRSAGLPSGLGEGGGPMAVQAFEGSLEPGLGGPGAVVIGVSHEGGTWATNRALVSAREAGATTALITAAANSPGAALAGVVVSSDELDQSWCHTIGYLSPILVAAAVGAHLAATPLDSRRAAALLASGLVHDATAAVNDLADGLADVERIIVIGSGVDRAAARELTLKIEEGSHVAAAMRDLETMLHGHLAATDERTGLVLILADPAARGARTARSLGALRSCREIGIRAGIIASEVVAGEVDPALTPAGRIVIPDVPDLPGAAGALIGTAVPLQRLALAIAIRRGIDPDPIRRDDPRYLAAADAAG